MVITTTMSDYEDLDEELPSVSLSQSCEKAELEMPPASEVASQRAREEAAERALQDLHENIAPRYISLSRSASQGSSGEEGEAALSAAVSALLVTETPADTHNPLTERLELMSAMRDHLPTDDTQFLDAYIRMLKDKPELVAVVTEKILQTISAALIAGWGTAGVCGSCAWLLCVSLTSTKAVRTRRALHALLDTHATSEHVEVVIKACTALQDEAELLLAAHDAVRSGVGRGADRLAASLLARATAAVLPTDEQEMKSLDSNPPAPLSIENINTIRASWRKMSPRSQLALLRCVGRALAARGERGKLEEGEREEGEKEETAALLDALAQPLPRASAFHEDRQQVLTNLSKLQLLFRSRFTPDFETDDILDNSQKSELTDTPTEETLTEDIPLTGETTMTEETTTRETITTGTSISVEAEISRSSTSGFSDTPIESTPTDTTMTTETNTKRETQKPAVETSTCTPKKQTQTKMDRFMTKTPKKETEERVRSPERKRSRRERHDRRCKKGPQL